METIIRVIDRTFIRYEPSNNNTDDVLTFAKPGHVIQGVYYPAESVTLFGKNLINELTEFVRALSLEQLKELSNADPRKLELAKYSSTVGVTVQSVSRTELRSDPSSLGGESNDLQDDSEIL
jgi:hypothetical protein